MEKFPTPYPSLLTVFLRVRIDPSFGEIDDEPFRVVATREAIRQAGDTVRAARAVAFPSNLRARAPPLVALAKRREGDDQAVVVVQISHGWENYIARK